jgi:hypothetical protein
MRHIRDYELSKISEESMEETLNEDAPVFSDCPELEEESKEDEMVFPLPEPIDPDLLLYQKKMAIINERRKNRDI